MSDTQATDLVFVLANQKQRHSLLRSVGWRVKHSRFERFSKLIASSEIHDLLDAGAAERTRGAAGQASHRVTSQYNR